jgi:hypothetical protein
MHCEPVGYVVSIDIRVTIYRGGGLSCEGQHYPTLDHFRRAWRRKDKLLIARVVEEHERHA